MKKMLVFLLLFGALNHSFAQSKTQIAITTSEVGTDYRTNTPIMAREYQFDLPVFRFYPAPNHQMLTVQVRKKTASTGLWKSTGRLTVADPGTGQIKWQKKLNYTGTVVQQLDNVIFEQKGNKLSRLNAIDGKTIWNRATTAYRLFPEFDLALCYDTPTTGFTTLYGINTSTGQSIWKRDISGEYGWQNTDMIADSTLMVVAQGLHTLDVRDGTGWDINRVSHAKKTDMAKVGLAILGGAAGAAMGYMMIPYGTFSDYYLNISSNILYDGDEFYFAAKDKISRHTLDGKALWKTDLDQKKTSKSHLFKEGNTIYMLNSGYALKYGRPAALGNPYVVAFDAESGTQLFLKEWEERKNFVSDYLIEGNELYLLYQDRVDIQRFSPEGLQQKYIARIDQDAKMSSFVTDEIFMKQDSSYSQTSLDRDHFYIFSEKGELFRFSNDFESSEKVDMNSLYKNYLQTDEYLFLGNKSETRILEKTTRREVARCDAPISSMRYDKKLYYAKDNKLCELDISNFISKQSPATPFSN
ncbi:PQQ-binding-like beta-propeller repeat protein [Dyadobacter sp. CY323]|uniref:outer membrane protein assembly factor BamB family protein n=1 Tax=Dyadobacter sp. CY323 TaxID=2907302 RepID=UPI001F2F358D|nr:PQQ-binding-like beta-propeller repeat protein [Dyadobacter sp. CY323]MCE6992014.1 PQQ-like beta-propeller repeat protein [Dyadobacter sp. CY323]